MKLPSTPLTGGLDPTTTSTAHTAMAERIRVNRIVFGGTESLRENIVEFLPKFEKERDENWSRRKKDARMRRNMFRQAVERVTGRIFEVPTRIVDPVGAGTRIADDADQRGHSLDRVARQMYAEALKVGMSCVLVDFPVVAAENLAQERALDPRPFLVRINPEQVLRCFEDDDGRITHLAWYEVVTQWNRSAGEQVSHWYIHERHIENGVHTAVTYKSRAAGPKRSAIPSTRDASEGWVVDSLERVVTVDHIMFHVLYAEKEHHMVGRTPLAEVVDLTIEHFQIASDYRSALRQSMFAILVATGVEQKDIGNIVLGPDSVLGSTSKDAKFAILEHNGSALDAGYKDLESLEQRAEAYAGRLTKASGDVKATTEAISAAEVSSFAKDLAQELQDTLQAILDDCAVWDNAETIGRVEVNMDFAVDLPDSDPTTLQSMRTAGDLTRRTLWREMQRRNTLSRDFDPDEEDTALEEQQAESLVREEEAMRFSAGLKAELGSGSPFPAKE